jgi:hypothetical protein
MISRPTTHAAPDSDTEEADYLQHRKAIASPEVRLNTRGRGGITVSPDEFLNNRVAAMRKTPSSRYNVFKYNYGGYIPFDFEHKKKKKKEIFCFEDYLDYLRSRTCDFIMDLLVDREEDERAMQKELEIQRNIQTAEEMRMQREAEKEARKERIRKLTTFERGLWNAGTLEYMTEIQSLGKQYEVSLDNIAEYGLERVEGHGDASLDHDEGEGSQDNGNYGRYATLWLYLYVTL